MKFKISHLVKTYPITFFAVIALFTASAVTAAKGVLLPLAIGEAALSVVLAVSAILKMHNEFRIIKNAVISLITFAAIIYSFFYLLLQIFLHEKLKRLINSFITS